jgi:hypothetical protein
VGELFLNSVPIGTIWSSVHVNIQEGEVAT